MENKFGKRQWKKEEKRFKTLDEYLSYQEQTVGKAKEITDEERKNLKGKRKVTGFEVTEDRKKKAKKFKSDKENKGFRENREDRTGKENKGSRANKEEKANRIKKEEKTNRVDDKGQNKKEQAKDHHKDSFKAKKEDLKEKKEGWREKKDSLKEKKENKKEKKDFFKAKDHEKDHDKKAVKKVQAEEMPENDAVENIDFPAEEENQNRIEGRNAVTEAFRSGRDVDKIFIQKDLHDGAISTIARMAKKAGTIINYVTKDRLNQMSQTGAHQGVIAYVAAYNYSTLEDILAKAAAKEEDPFIFLLDGIEDPHNLGAIIRTANLCGAHGVVITKHRAAGLTATVAKASAGALNYTPVAKVTNLSNTIDQLKKDGMWFVCADMGGTNMYQLELKGSIGLIIGNEGEGVSRLIKEKCDFIASIPMKGDIDSLNASVAAGVLGFEISRQRG